MALDRNNAAMDPKSHPMLLIKKQMKQEVDRPTTELQLITSQRNERQDHLTFISEDTMENRPYHKPNPFYEKLKLEHAQVMSELRTLEADYTETSEKFSELNKETVFYHGIRPPGELKPILKKSPQISGDNGRNQDQISLRLSENPHVTTADKATNTTKEDIENSSSRYTIIQKQILYSKKIAAMKKRDQKGLSKSVMDLSTLGEALAEFSRKKSCLVVETKKGEGFLPPSNMHDLVPQPPAHADVTSTSHVSERGDYRCSSEETTVNTTSVNERGDNRCSSEETTVNTTSVSERGDNRRSSEKTTVNTTSVSERGDYRCSSEETTVNTTSVSERGDNRRSSEKTVNTTSVDHTPSLGDTLDPQNACKRVLASSPADCTSYAGNTHSKIFLIWAATTSLLLLTLLVWLLQLVALMMTWMLNLF